MSHWNYRFIRHKKYSDDSYAIQLHEVYYGDDGQPTSCTLHPINVYSLVEDGNGQESESEQLQTLKEMIVAAFDKPVLDMSIFDRL